MRRFRPYTVALLAAGLLLAPLTLSAQPPGHAGPGAAGAERGPPGQRSEPRSSDQRRDDRQRSDDRVERWRSEYGEGRFRDQEREIIREWLRERQDETVAGGPPGRPQTPGRSGGQRTLPPGLQQRLERGGELPPGWQRKVARGEVVDSELIRYSRVSPDLRRRLPRQPTGTELLELEDQVVRVLETTGLVLDVLDILTE
ncbi:hypothetical protein [Alkalilimnicola ehrlichii]|uniref:hypothetical protein n=1 Tax=Alkalilimnicola ehrlichii TaxID=351052 RepID=UPI003BA3A651